MHDAPLAKYSLQRQDVLKEARIEEAAAAAATRGNPELGDFLRVFFARGAAEDLAASTSGELLALAETAMADLARRTVGRHRVSVYDPDQPVAGEAHRSVTVIEILNDNMPFLVDSVMHELTEAGVDVRLLVHPILSVTRDADGALTGFAEPDAPGSIRESLIHVHVARLPDAGQRNDLGARLERVLNDVRNAVSDWPAMRARLTEIISDYRDNPPPLPVDALAEAIEFLSWLAEDNFTFLGLRDYDVTMANGDADRIALKPESGLGLLADPDVRVLRRGKELVQVTPEIREFMMRPEPLIVAKANVKSRVHRRAYMDYVGIKRYDPDGRLVGEVRLVGLFTASAYTRSTKAIPYLRHKVDRVMTRAGFDPESHSGKTLLNVLESYPRDDLFQIDFETLYDFAIAILELDERPRIRVLARRDKFDRFVSVLVFVPRDRFSTEVRLRIGDYLRTVFEGRVSAFYPSFPEGSLTRIHFIIGRDEGATPDPSRAELEAAVTAIVRTWGDAFQEVARARLPLEKARATATRWAAIFSPAYRDSYAPDEALDDTGPIDRLSTERPTVIAFRVPKDATAPGEIALKLYHRGGAVPLSERVPVLEAMGFRVIEEQSFDLIVDGQLVSLHDMRLLRADGGAIDLAASGEALRALFMAVWLGEAESDRLNALLVKGGLAWREIALLRGLSRYLQQARIPYEQGYVADTLNRNPDVATAIVALFTARFDPTLHGDRALAEARAANEIEQALEAVTSLDDDVILRRFTNLVQAAVRTTFFQLGPDGRPRPVIAFKFDPHRVEGLPEPRPFAEIWVYSPRVEGVHLRFGKVARGGLRWSDRPQDFRTEVLGLVKAQQVKNAVIVPVGAKGGFFPKKLPAGGSRDAVFQEGTEAYKLFVSTLLDLTDDIDGERIVPPAATVRHDADDPYLVVAADKGTATFSDTANGLADARRFWLSDAFASGGSVGYDHKKMGITARGAWEAVKRHFREQDIDIQATPFTVAGVGDMSGDVFGNGMLLSRKIRLVAAFDHRDIFIDPTPDEEVSFAERERLFALPRSSWQDYDAAKISAGGGVFSRQAKAITLSPEAQALLQLPKARATPHEVMTAILKAPVDLLWFGGIGTYVRGPDETDAEVGDRANDAIRVVATDIHAKVIGEGANLGMTQKARIAYGLKGGRCNSDAVDNSAGVNSSDVEVNIKIALGRPVREGRLAIADRNTLLAAMTPEVARLVLANNYRQSLCVSLAERRGLGDLGYQRRLMQWLEGRRRLDRVVETLPDDAALARREKAAQPLTRSEIGVLMAYAKIVLYDDLLESTLPDDAALEADLLAYFPAEMQASFPDDIRAHRLRREIIATVLANAVVNRGGPTFPIRIADQTGVSMAEVVRGFLMASESFGLADLEAAIDELDNRVSGAVQLELYARVQDVLTAATLWFVRNADIAGDIPSTAARYREGIARFRSWSGAEGGADAVAAERERLEKAGVPASLAAECAWLRRLLDALDVIEIAGIARQPIEIAAAAAEGIAGLFRIATIDNLARQLTPADYYEGLALDRARRALAEAHRAMAAGVAERTARGDGLDAWHAARREEVDRTVATIESLLSGTPTVARFTVAAGLLQDLAKS
ncbi:NAD-glutamate dehydrogenase [Chthonobacter albigriseus]|uniref:NAD-glutamate dehydrogenase n=1 Tax=Chthonobacter albigriseus TaxID=1683161 RepID=UPI0015EE5F0B|nr:NAD-glutamate dehydrogenase [Chthonobacter albigriseus]